MTGKAPIKGRWVDVNKGDDDMPNHRSRYVAREIRQVHGGKAREGLFAAMPPTEALKLVLSKAVTFEKGQTHLKRKLLFIDVSKAYLHADVMDNSLYVDLPQEAGKLGYCAHLKKAVYGTREAARC